MFSCFGLRPRHKGLPSSAHSEAELRDPLTPKDGVPLNYHNHHHKYTLHQQYINSSHRSSFSSSRCNSQVSTSTSSRRNSGDLSLLHQKDGFKITDFDHNTASDAMCEEVAKSVLLECQSKKKGNHKKKKTASLPKNAIIHRKQNVYVDHVHLKNEKNNVISEIFNNNEISTDKVITNDAVHPPVERNKFDKTNTPELQNTTARDARPATDLNANARKDCLKQALNRSLSPTDLDSVLALSTFSYTLAECKVSNNRILSQKIDLAPIAQNESPQSLSLESINTISSNKEKANSGGKMTEFEKRDLSSIATTIVPKTNGSLPTKPINVRYDSNFTITATTCTLPNNTLNTMDVTLTPTPEGEPLRIASTIRSTDMVTPLNGLVYKRASETKPSSKLPSKMLSSSYHNKGSSNQVKTSHPASYTRLPIAQDRKPSLSKTKEVNAAVATSEGVTTLIKTKVTAATNNGHGGGSPRDDKTPPIMSIVDDSGIPLIDMENTTLSDSKNDSCRFPLNGSFTKNDENLNDYVSYSDLTVPCLDLSSCPKSASYPVPVACSTPTLTSVPPGDCFKSNKRKLSTTEPFDDQPLKSSRNPRSTAPDVAELKHLEAELSARTSEAEEAKREAREARSEAGEATKGVEALTILVHHLTHQYEAFSNPHLKIEIARLHKNLQEAEVALGESRSALQAAETRLSEQQASATLEAQQLNAEHSSAVSLLQEHHHTELQQLKQNHAEQLEELAAQHRQDTDTDLALHQQETAQLTEQHQQQLAEVCRLHGIELVRLNCDLQQQRDLLQENLRHRDLPADLDCPEAQVSELLASHAAREQELQTHGSSLQREHEKLREHSKKLQESLLSDNDHRLTAVKNYCTALQQEVDSLKSVVEMRNSELHKLRAQVTGMETLQRDLDAARQCAKTLQAKTEDLNAQMDAKAKAERELLSSNRQLLENINKENSVNKQLRLENEQLQWKLRQREQLSNSLPISTLDLMTRVSHLDTSWEKRPASLHHQQLLHRESQQSQGCKNITRADQKPVTSTPASQTNNGKKESETESQADDNEQFDGYLKNCQGDIIKSSPCLREVVKKMNSVSFTLELEPVSDNYSDFPTSPNLRRGTPTLTRKSLQKSRSSSLEKKVGSQMGRNASLSKCTSAGDFFFNGSHPEIRSCKRNSIDSKLENGTFSITKQIGEHNIRLNSTSESSEGAESENLEESIERVSPSGLAWTVPVNDSSSNSPRSPRNKSQRHNLASLGLRHLHQPEEDEYEENLEDSEDGFDGLHPDITPLVNLMNASSSSPSDSELSRCGSQAGLTSESEEESSLAEGDRVGDSLSPVAEVAWVPQVGAGEAMIPSELVDICSASGSTNGSDQSCKGTPTKDVKSKEALSQVTSHPFTDRQVHQMQEI